MSFAAHHVSPASLSARAQRARGANALRAASSRRASAGRSSAAVQVHANLFNRVGRVFKSYANSVVSAAEDPEKMLEQTVNEMRDDLVKMRQASAQVMASQKQMEAKYKQAQTNADDWFRRAQLALQKGDDDLAKQALTRKKSFQETADSLKMQLDSQRDATTKLIENTKILETKIQEAKYKKEALKARAASAKTTQAVAGMVGNLSTSSSVAAFERMEEKVNQMEAEADAVQAIAGGDALEQEFKMLESSDVDLELELMKKQLGDGGQSKPAETKKPVSDSIEAELEELRRKAREQ